MCQSKESGESKCFWIDSGVRKGGIISAWLFNAYMDEVRKEVKMGMGEDESEISAEGGRVEIPWSLVQR